MKIISGKEARGAECAVMGRLIYIHEKGKDFFSGSEAIIPIMHKIDRELFEDDRVVGAVLISPSDNELYGEDNSFPILVFDESGKEALRETDGQLAYLDIGRRLLISGPDIDTVNKYESQKRESAGIAREKKEEVLISLDMGDGDPLPIRTGNLIDLDGKKVDISQIDRSEYEERLFEQLCSVFDKGIDHPLSVRLVFPNNDEEAEKVSAAIKAIYRASVYGEISVMCGGIDNISEVKGFSQMLHESFCFLEETEREIDSYTKKGICCENFSVMFSLLVAGMSSSQRSEVSWIPYGIDYVTFDIDRLTEGKSDELWKRREQIRQLFKGMKQVGDMFGAVKLRVREERGIEVLRRAFYYCRKEEIFKIEEIYTDIKGMEKIKKFITSAQ